MTLEINKGDRLYKIVVARTFIDQRKVFISKIDRNNNITVLTYTFEVSDIKKDGTVDNKKMMMLIKEFDEDKFKFIIDTNRKIYPEFKILYEKNYSDKSLVEAIELMNLERSIVTDIPISNIIQDIRNR